MSDMLRLGKDGIMWVNELEMVYVVTSQEFFEKNWFEMTGYEVKYANITRGLRFEFEFRF